jgi:hypothetical protein
MTKKTAPPVAADAEEPAVAPVDAAAAPVDAAAAPVDEGAAAEPDAGAPSSPSSAEYTVAFSPRQVAVGFAIVAGLVAIAFRHRRRRDRTPADD